MPQAGISVIKQSGDLCKLDGLHVVANLYRCKGDARYLTDAAKLRQFCHDSIKRAGLTILGDLFHQFEGGGVTGTVVLAESHLAIHTWPELQSVTVDVYVCNYTQDNNSKARQVVADVMGLFLPEEHVQHDVPRDRQFMYEWLNGDCGFFLRSSKLVESSRTRFQDLEIHETPQFGKLLRLDGCFMTSEREEFVYHETLMHTALTAHPAPKRVLVIGGGDGGAVEEALKHPSVDQVVMVELDERVVEVAKQHFATIHRGVFDNPRLRLLIDDGLKYLVETKEKFDHIALDLPDPIGPAAALYEEAFFRDCKKALTPGGILTLHMGSPWSRPDRVRMLYGRLAKMFKIARPYAMFIPLYGSLWSMCACSGSADVAALSAAEIDTRVTNRGLAHLQYYNGAIHQALFALPNFVRELTVNAVPKPRLVASKKRA
jgi:spermidine synthase